MRKIGKVFFRKTESDAEKPAKEQTMETVNLSIELIEIDEEPHIEITCPVCDSKFGLPVEAILQVLKNATLPDHSREYIRRPKK